MLCEVCPDDHEYVPPPVDGLAVRVADCPVQIVGELTLTVAPGVTITSIIALWLSQPPTVCVT